VCVGDLDDYESGLHAINTTTGEREWAFREPDWFVVSSPTVSEGTAYVGASDGTLYAVDAASGNGKWSFDEPPRAEWIVSSPTVVDETVYVGSDDGNLYAVDASTGESEWIFTDPSGALQSSPAVTDGTVYVGSMDSSLYAVATASGEREWSFDEPSGGLQSSPAVVGDTVYCISMAGNLYAVNAATGTQKWSIEGRLRGSPTFFEGTIYAGSTSELNAIDAETGDTLWTYDEQISYTNGAWDIQPSPTVVESTVFYNSTGALHAVDIDNGEQRWKLDIASRSTPTVYDGTVYVGAGEKLYAVDADTGDTIWVYDDVGPLLSSPTVVSNPADGNSVGSRVRLGALGHHDETIEILNEQIGAGSATNQTDATSTAGDDDLSGFGLTAAVAGLGGGYALNRRRNDSVTESDR